MLLVEKSMAARHSNIQRRQLHREIKEISMGSVWRRRYKDSDGKERTLSIWWIKYRSHGRVIRESAETVDYAEAKDFLRRREGETTRGHTTKSVERKVLFDELAKLVEKDYEINGYRSVVDIELRHRLNIMPFFGKWKATRITASDVDDYILRRRSEKESNATINRKLVTIKRAFSLGIQKRIVSDRPHIALLKEDNVRQGFFERDQFESLKIHLPKHLKPVAGFAHITGWRRGEFLSLKRPQVDFAAETVSLLAGTTKNDQTRVFPFTAELPAVLEEQRRKVEAFRKEGVITPWVFFLEWKGRRGRPIGEFKHS
jgi:integrase